MLHLRRLLIILAPPAALLLLMSCGPLVTGSTQSAPTPTVITGHKLTATPTARRTPIAKPTATSNPPATTVGSVTLQLGALLYHMGDTITVTIRNGSNQTIVFPDHLTNCTVILLDHVGQVVGLCKLMIVTRLYRLGAGESLTVTLRVPSSGWPVGLYQAVLTYRTPGGAHTVSSTGFLLA